MVDPGPVVDGSGAVTGLAFYRLQQDHKLLSREKENLNDKLQRLKKEYMAQKDRLSSERYDTPSGHPAALVS